MKKFDSKQRLFENMKRVDSTFKPRLNEEFEASTDDASTLPASTGEETPEIEEKTPEEELQELTAKVDELYAMLHGESEEVPSEETGEESLENLQEWNFDKKKGDKEEKKDSGKKKFNFEKKENKESKEHEESETPEEEKKEHKGKKELDEVKPKLPVVPIAKVGGK